MTNDKKLLPKCDLNVLEAAEIRVTQGRKDLTQEGMSHLQSDWLRQHAQEARNADIGLAREQMAKHRPEPPKPAFAPVLSANK